MKKQDFSSLTADELRQKEKTLRDELFKLNQQRFAGRVEKPHMFGLIKRDIARIQTILNAKKEK
jgi:large subunit ribosomal protein L29